MCNKQIASIYHGTFCKTDRHISMVNLLPVSCVRILCFLVLASHFLVMFHCPWYSIQAHITIPLQVIHLYPSMPSKQVQYQPWCNVSHSTKAACHPAQWSSTRWSQMGSLPRWPNKQRLEWCRQTHSLATTIDDISIQNLTLRYWDFLFGSSN